jgi:hypothetical protein
MKRLQMADSYAKNDNDQLMVPRVVVDELKLSL